MLAFYCAECESSSLTTHSSFHSYPLQLTLQSTPIASLRSISTMPVLFSHIQHSFLYQGPGYDHSSVHSLHCNHLSFAATGNKRIPQFDDNSRVKRYSRIAHSQNSVEDQLPDYRSSELTIRKASGSAMPRSARSASRSRISAACNRRLGASLCNSAISC